MWEGYDELESAGGCGGGVKGNQKLMAIGQA